MMMIIIIMVSILIIDGNNSAQDPIFITEGIEIEEETDGSTLTVHNLQLEDQVNDDDDDDDSSL